MIIIRNTKVGETYVYLIDLIFLEGPLMLNLMLLADLVYTGQGNKCSFEYHNSPQS
jgi:hypothetical protein